MESRVAVVVEGIVVIVIEWITIVVRIPVRRAVIETVVIAVEVPTVPVRLIAIVVVVVTVVMLRHDGGIIVTLDFDVIGTLLDR
jgi:hypothetical protein